MLNTLVQTKLGARFRIAVANAETGEITQSSDWMDNMILDVATAYMETGFAEEPIPKLGSSIADVAADQMGVQAEIVAMTMISKKVLWDARFTRTNNNTATVSWGTQYTYKNNGVVAVSVSEIGIDNFNRATFKDENGMVRSWSVSPSEKLIVDMDFVIKFTTPTAPIAISTVDNENVTVESLNVNLTVANQVTTGTAQWWKLLSKPAVNVGLVTDQNFTGITPPNGAAIVRANISSNYVYTGRNVAIEVIHRAGTGGQTYYGLLVEFGCLMPAFGVVFSKGIHVGSGYTFKSNMTVTW